MSYYRSRAFSESTKENYASHLSAYVKFCNHIGQVPRPHDTQQNLRFLAHISQKLRYSSLSQYANIIRLLNIEQGLHNPLQSWPIQSFMQGVKRSKGNAPRRKLPITPALLLRIQRLMDFSKPSNRVLWAAYLMSFFTLLRKSNIVPPSQAKFDSKRQPCRSDLRRARQGFVLHIKETKTIQFKERDLLLPIPYLPRHPLCPTTALIAVLALLPTAPPSTPLFAYPAYDGLHVLTQAALSRHLKEHLRCIGVDPTVYSAHSFRRGGASWALQCGMPGELIQVLGDWRSDCYQKYLQLDVSTKFTLLSPFSKNLPTL